MPVITRRQPLLDLRGKTASLALSDTLSLQSPCEDNDARPLYFLTDESFAQKEMEFPGSESPARPLTAPSKTRSNLRITTQSSLHSRYQSSEESISPSPDSSSDEAEEPEQTPTHPPSSTEADLDPMPALDDSTDADSDTDNPVPLTPPAVATRIAIFHAGRPKLISIAALAPLHKRKRAPPPPLRYPSSTHAPTTPPSPNPSSEYHSAPTSPPAKRPTTAIRTHPSPAVWLSNACGDDDEDSISLSESDEADELLHGTHGASSFPSSCPSSHIALDDDDDIAPAEPELYFPPAELGSPTPTTYAAYDPYSLDPPRLGGGGAGARVRKYATVSGDGVYGAGVYGAGPAVVVAVGGEGEKRTRWRGLGLFGRRGGFEAGMGKGRREGQGAGPGPLLGAFVFEE